MEEEKIEQINLGEFNLPTKWEELTLKQLSDLERLYSTSGKVTAVDMIATLTNRTVDEIMALPLPVAERLMTTIAFVTQPPQDEDPTPTITVDGIDYTVHTSRQLRTGEAIAAMTLIDADPYDYPGILAIVCRKEGELYDAHYENEILPERKEMFSRVPAVDAKRVIAFFLSNLIARELPSRLSSECAEELDKLASDIDNLAADGVISVSSTRSLRKALKKLRKLHKRTSQTISN